MKKLPSAHPLSRSTSHGAGPTTQVRVSASTEYRLLLLAEVTITPLDYANRVNAGQILQLILARKLHSIDPKVCQR